LSLFDFLKKKKKDKAIIPIPRKRISSDEVVTYSSLLNTANSRLNIIDPKVPTAFLDIIEKLCVSNPDFSQTLSNIIKLGNTGHEITITASRENVINAATERLNKLAATINTDQLVNKLLRQMAVSGALSIEWVAKPDLSGIEKVVLVPVKTIRFKYDRKDDVYKANQYIQNKNDYIELNETTYAYSAMETSDNSPYGIPPFLAALGNAVIQLFMMENMKFIIKKLGLLGFISVAIEAPSQAPGETDAAYQNRLSSYLNEFATNFATNYRDGVAAHFDNMQIGHHNIAGDARGAKEILQMNEEQVASGLKTDPALLGRSYSTTETYAGVVYAIMIKQVENYQMLIKRAIEKGYRLDLLLNGILMDDVSVHFNPNDALKPHEEAEAEAIRTDTVISKMDAGIISPDDAARELGYEKAYNVEFEPDTGESEQSNKFVAQLSFKNGKYHVKNIAGPIQISLAPRKKDDNRDPEGIIERRRQRFIDKYFSDVEQINQAALAGALGGIKSQLSFLVSHSPEVFAKAVYDMLVEYHPAELLKLDLKKHVLQDVLIIFKYYRFRDRLQKGKRIPVRLSMPDRRAIKFLNSLDDFHISKHITNKPVQKRMLNFLKVEHLEGRTAKVDGFMKTFGKELGDISKSQVQNIVDSSVSRLRNWGHIRQLSEMRAAKAVISEVMDSITCETCREMHGKEFVVAHADQKIMELSFLESDAFVERVYDQAPEGWKKDPADYARKHSMEDFIANDIVGPPFHGRCRGRVKIK